MPGVAMDSITTIHPIAGVDYHRTIPPPLPMPLAPEQMEALQHAVVWE